MERWATFDCYGTLIDWNGGIGRELERLFGADKTSSLLHARIGVRFDLVIVASEIGSYKPGHRHWEVFTEQTGADPAGHVHVAASLFHDIAPATELRLPTIWINRLGEEPEPQPDVELRTLAGLGEALDGLVA